VQRPASISASQAWLSYAVLLVLGLRGLCYSVAYTEHLGSCALRQQRLTKHVIASSQTFTTRGTTGCGVYLRQLLAAGTMPSTFQLGIYVSMVTASASLNAGKSFGFKPADWPIHYKPHQTAKSDWMSSLWRMKCAHVKQSKVALCSHRGCDSATGST